MGAIVGLIVRQIAFAPLKGGSELSPFVTSAAMALILKRRLFISHKLYQFLNGSDRVYNLPRILFSSWRSISEGLFDNFIVADNYGLHWWLKHTKSGMAIRSVRKTLLQPG